MESLVSYCSDDEENESCPGNETGINQREMDVVSRQADEDTNYDNVQMDMSEESNNNNSPDRNSSGHSGDSSDSEKSSVGSSHSRSRKSSLSSNGNSPDRSSREPAPSLSATSKVDVASKERSSDSKALRTQSQGKEFTLKSHSRSQNYEGKDHASESLKKDYSNRERGGRNERVRDKDRTQDNRTRGHSKDRREGCRSQSQERRSHSRGKDQRSSPHGRDRDRHHTRSKVGSPDRKRARSRSRSPGHSYSSSRHSDSSSSRSSKESHRARSRSRDRQSSSTRSRSKERIDRHRSRSKERQRSRSRERRRGAYEKKPNKLTILERLGIELRPPDSMPAVTPQQLLQRSMEQQVAQVKSSTGIELPKYYNPAAMNPMRYAEQMQKRRLLWGNKSNTQEAPGEPKPTSNNKWEGTTFAQDQDGKMTAKFKRLMGIKDSGQGAGASNSSAAVDSNELLKKQEELFNSMEMQYEVARVATHTHRGVGLGFGTFQYPR